MTTPNTKNGFTAVQVLDDAVKRYQNNNSTKYTCNYEHTRTSEREWREKRDVQGVYSCLNMNNGKKATGMVPFYSRNNDWRYKRMKHPHYFWENGDQAYRPPGLYKYNGPILARGYPIEGMDTLPGAENMWPSGRAYQSANPFGTKVAFRDADPFVKKRYLPTKKIL
jgi:hypothetical protein